MSKDPPYGGDPQQPGYPQYPQYPPPDQGQTYPPPGFGQPGYPPAGYPQGYSMALGMPYGQPEQGRGMAVAGLILGIISIPAAFTIVCGVVFGLLGILFGALGRRSDSRRTMATVGLALSIVGVGLSLLLFVVGAAVVNNGGLTTTP